MSQSFSLFPTLTDELVNSINIECKEICCCYTDDNQEYSLTLSDEKKTPKSFSALLTDERCTWSADSHNLIIRRKIFIGKALALFGYGGIADEDDVLGIAVQWSSPSSCERGVSIIKDPITRAVSNHIFDFEMKMNPGFFKGDIELETIIYLRQKGKHKDSVCAKKVGTILGVIDTTILSLDGTGSKFPIVVVSEEDKPLWWLFYADSIDASEDKFTEDNVRIVINKAHKDYPLLNMESSVKESPLFIEVLASALLQIVERVKTDMGDSFNDVINDDNLEPGSVAKAVNFFISNLNWRFTNVNELSMDIRDFLTNSLGGVS